MNRAEAGGLLAYLNAAWPSAKLPQATAQLWLDEMVSIDPDVGAQVVKALVRRCQWFPSLAEFLADAYAEQERRSPTVKALPPAAPDEVTQQRIRRLIAEAKAASARKGEHWHGGPAPCPVCGGIRPDLADAAGSLRLLENGG